MDKKPTESPGGSTGSGIYRPVPEEPERVKRPAPPESEEDEDDIFRGIERLSSRMSTKKQLRNLSLH